VNSNEDDLKALKKRLHQWAEARKKILLEEGQRDRSSQISLRHSEGDPWVVHPSLGTATCG
jgi:hypothetical protein